MNKWQSEATMLSDWCSGRMAIKKDRFGCYAANGSARWSSSPLSQEILESHFRGEQTIGLGTTSVDDQCLFVALDLDNHVSDQHDNANLAYAIVVAERLRSLGVTPLIEDSDGKGGIHLFVFFSSPVKSETAYNFIRSVVRDFKEHQLEKIECFPKQRTVSTTEKKCGNYIRVPGKHHKRAHWSRFWGDDSWLSIEDSVDLLLKHSGDDPNLIPATCTEDHSGSNEVARKPDVETSQVISDARLHVQKSPRAIAGKRGHDVTFKLACDLVRGFELPDADALRLMDHWNKKCLPPWTTSELQKKISDARKASGKTGYLLVTRIRIDLDEESVNDKVIETLTQKADLYCYAGRLAVVRPKSSTGQLLELMIQILPEANLREFISSSCRFYSGGGAKSHKFVRVPGWCTKAIFSRGHWRGIPTLAGIVNHPVFRHDGTILQKNGFDRTTGVYVNMVSEFPPVPDAPSAEEVAAAIQLLQDVVSDFPFKDGASRSAWLASVFTPLVRDAHNDRTGPLFLISANDSGAGKGLLADVTWLIVTGRLAEETPAPANNEEMRKLISTYVRSGARMVLFDDVAGSLGCASLNAALTGTTWNDRLLKENSLIEGPLRITFYATGNNVDLKGDMVRRVCRISLETVDEHPEERSGFKYPRLIEHVRAHRPALVAAALTILRGYVAAGRPAQNLTAWGSFGDWSNIVRATLVWSGLPDPADTIVDLRETSDEDADALRLLYESLWQLTKPGTGKRCQELIAIARGVEVSMFQRQFAADLKEGIEGLCGIPILQVDHQKLGTVLRRYRNRMIEGKVLRCVKSNGHNHWRIEPGGVGGIGGIQSIQAEITEGSSAQNEISKDTEEDISTLKEMTSPMTTKPPGLRDEKSDCAKTGTACPEVCSAPLPAGPASEITASTSAAVKKTTNKKKVQKKASRKTPSTPAEKSKKKVQTMASRKAPSTPATMSVREEIPRTHREDDSFDDFDQLLAEFDLSNPPHQRKEETRNQKKRNLTERTASVKTPRKTKKSNRRKS